MLLLVVRSGCGRVQFDEDERARSPSNAPSSTTRNVSFGGLATRIATSATKPPTVAIAAPTRNALRCPCNPELSVSVRTDPLAPWLLTVVFSQLRDTVVATVTRTASPSVPPI